MRRLWRPILDALVPYDAGLSLEALARQIGRTDLVRLSANENPLGPSPLAVAAVEREAARIHLYPDGGSTGLREALGRSLGVRPNQIVVGNGADELIALIAAAAFEPADEVVVPTPSFEPYEISAKLAGARVVESPLAGYDTDLDDVLRRVTDRTKAVMLCSPHNPATTIFHRRALLAFLDSLGPDSPLVVLDQAYIDFCDDAEHADGIRLLERYPRLVVLRTFSKIAGLAGLRVGYAVASAETIDRFNRVRAPYNVNRLGQVAALAALEDHAHVEKTVRLVLDERAYLSAELTKRGYAFPASHANFLLVAVPDAPGLRAHLMRAGILVRDGAGVGFPGHLRFSVGLRETNEKLLSLL
ncbi:MAG: histidinol-phosphate transaminase [Candidatus Rokuibacteriota bacterium]